MHKLFYYALLLRRAYIYIYVFTYIYLSIYTNIRNYRLLNDEKQKMTLNGLYYGWCNSKGIIESI
jgi:hypothetical protein